MARGGKRDRAGAPRGKRNAKGHEGAGGPPLEKSKDTKPVDKTAPESSKPKVNDRQYAIQQQVLRIEAGDEKRARQVIERKVGTSSKNPIRDYAIQKALDKMHGQKNVKGKDEANVAEKRRKMGLGCYFGAREAAAYAGVSKRTILYAAKKKGMIYVRGSDNGWQMADARHTSAWTKKQHDDMLLARYGPINGPKQILSEQQNGKLNAIEKEIETAIEKTIDTYK